MERSKRLLENSWLLILGEGSWSNIVLEMSLLPGEVFRIRRQDKSRPCKKKEEKIEDRNLLLSRKCPEMVGELFKLKYRKFLSK